MPYYEPQPIPTAEVAFTSRTVDQLKQLAALLPGCDIPSRKTELVIIFPDIIADVIGECRAKSRTHTTSNG